MLIPAQPDSHADEEPSTSREKLQQQILHAAHLLPSQGPITAFVHHNTLHALEHLPFSEAVMEGLSRYGCQPYLPEETYRRCLENGRIQIQDLETVLMQDLGDRGDELIGFLGSRYHLRLSMLEHSFRMGTEAEIRWLIEEQAALSNFMQRTPEDYLRGAIESTKHWFFTQQRLPAEKRDQRFSALTQNLLQEFGPRPPSRWSQRAWESFTLHLLWRICLQGVHGVPRFQPGTEPLLRHRDLLLKLTGTDADLPVNELLIRFCSSFLDQGFANWKFPIQAEGFYHSFLKFQTSLPHVAGWSSGLPREARRLLSEAVTPLESIEESLRLLGVTENEQEEFITQTLLALRGWSGMIWQMETNADWATHPAPAGTLIDYLAVRLLLERICLSHLAGPLMTKATTLSQLRPLLRKQIIHAPRVSVEQRAFVLFQMSQIRGWNPLDLYQLPKSGWKQLLEETESFDVWDRCRIYHLAYEQHFRKRALDALHNHGSRGMELTPTHDITFQVVTCIDDREESIRRHLEETDPQCQTYGAPGFFAVAMHYQGAADAYYRPLCPNAIKPRHYVKEMVAYSLTASSRQRAAGRRTLGAVSHHWHVQSRTFLGGIVTALLGSLATVPMVSRILFPHATSRWQRLFDSFFVPPAVTELTLSRLEETPGREETQLGFSLAEKADIVERVLRDIGLTENFAPIVLMLGHGSGSLNNPHESAYNCGACSGGRGGPNARAFAQMANDSEVRRILLERGILLTAETIFIGGYHNTCDDDVVYYDLERIPFSHRKRFESLQATVDVARARDACERSRWFGAESRKLSPAEALEHVQTRAEDLSQARPEYNHATNSLTVVGRRQRTRGLFLDRRVFMNSYDPSQDDEQGKILERILSAAVPVCAGISLEYYFSSVDNSGYGCGSKLPHNIVSLLGVMEGASSDLRPGLSQQMVEIHEPMRMLFVIETTPDVMNKIMSRHAGIARPIQNSWVQLALLDPLSQQILLYESGQFVPYVPETARQQVCRSSVEWAAGRRGHLEFASFAPSPERLPREGEPVHGA